MCRLFGLIANKSVDVKFSMLEADKPFRNLGSTSNPAGWGIGWYENNKAKIFKEGISAMASEKFYSFAKDVRFNIIIVHVRKSTEAPPEVNSHPFKYKNWIFAHNGSVNRDYLLSLLKDNYRKELKWETDSEVYFYWIMQCIEETKDVIEGIKKSLIKL